MGSKLINKLCLIFLILNTAVTQDAKPGHFFWKPRLNLRIPSPPTSTIFPPSKDNIEKGLVVLINGYSLGITVLSLAAGYQAAAKSFHHLNPLHANYYTNAYRWALRHLELLPDWLGGKGGQYADTHKVWRRRYYYLNKFVPDWTRTLLPWVKKSEWQEEIDEYKLFVKHAESTFGYHYKSPGLNFTNWASQGNETTYEDSEVSL